MTEAWFAELSRQLHVAPPRLAARDTAEPIAWAHSGAMALTGHADGPPLLTRGSPATFTQQALDVIAACRGEHGADVRVLGERAAAAGFSRQAPWSPGGRYRAFPTQDSWFGISLARDEDRELVPALVEASDTGEPWLTVEQWLARTSTADAAARSALLGLAAAPLQADPSSPRHAPVVAAPGGQRGGGSASPLVVDLSALWAGPLCAHLLANTGATVVKVESTTRLDGARYGPSGFYDLLHAGHESVTLDLATDIALLETLLCAADVVIEASRPRALVQLGIDAREYVARGTIWVSLTAYGRAGDDAMRIGFGDDVAAGAGLVVFERGQPCPVGDAIADPLSGVAAAAAVSLALRGDRGCLLDVSMHDVTVAAAQPADATSARVVHDGTGWSVLCGDARERVAPPTCRTPIGRAAPPGAHTAQRCAP